MKDSGKFTKRLLDGRLRTGALAIMILILTVLTILAFNGDLSWASANSGSAGTMPPKTSGPKERPLVTVNNLGETVVVDRETGVYRELSQDESRRLAEGLKQIINNSGEGLVEVVQRDGSVSMDLKGHFHNAMVVRKEADGTLTHSCINDLRAAAAFFDIDPQLLGVEGPVTKFNPAKAEER